ncbi:MAG: tRNA preQ1(34) S-adenosylmethionine ribosyltransferase-isomerase QueA [Candidatus Binataceae bacterium]
MFREESSRVVSPMRLSELDYDLPEELIAQEPLAERGQARLLVMDRRAKSFEHSRFYKLVGQLRDGDLLVLNDTRVIPARLFARKESGGRVELLLVRPYAEGPPGGWVALVRVHRQLKAGTRLLLDGGGALKIVGYARPGRPIVVSEGADSIEETIERAGRLALPHYIRRPPGPGDLADYQTVYAAAPGAIAAPTAGLHFTPELFQELAAAGIRTAAITLHIGPGTFAPVRAAEVERHSMEAEWYTITATARDSIDHARRTGGRVIPVGTSAVRALESWAITGDSEGSTGLFIHPGFRFKISAGMITNFHLPRTTVLALVMALAGRDPILAAYREAIRHRYRFLSYGDAMLIL